jgi:hypothetical protein
MWLVFIYYCYGPNWRTETTSGCHAFLHLLFSTIKRCSCEKKLYFISIKTFFIQFSHISYNRHVVSLPNTHFKLSGFWPGRFSVLFLSFSAHFGQKNVRKARQKWVAMLYYAPSYTSLVIIIFDHHNISICWSYETMFKMVP